MEEAERDQFVREMAREHVAVEEKTMAAIADNWALCEECWKGVE